MELNAFHRAHSYGQAQVLLFYSSFEKEVGICLSDHQLPLH